MGARLRAARDVTFLILVAVVVAVGSASVIFAVRHSNQVTAQRDTAIRSLTDDTATLQRVSHRLATIDTELATLAATKHADPAQLERLHTQVERLNATIASGRMTEPAPVVVVTRTAEPHPLPRPYPSVTVTVPACPGPVRVGHVCLTPVPSASLTFGR